MASLQLIRKLFPAKPAAGNGRLTLGQRICYGVGHIFNDLCANCWFSYLLIYMNKVVGLSNSNAGIVLLVGQVADAIFTPFIGYGCDKTNWKRYGRRKLWHAIGTFSVLASFPFVFNLCINCKDSSQVVKLLYYSCFVIVFQFGWAAVQISHLSLIPEIACKVSEKVELNAIRSGLTFFCGIFVFGVNWLLLGSNSEESVTPAVAPQFGYLTIVVVTTGSLFSLIFHIGIIEPKQICNTGVSNRCVKKRECLKKIMSPQSGKKVPSCIGNGGGSDKFVNDAALQEENAEENTVLVVERNCGTTTQERCKTWKEWFKSPLFYKMAVVYMCTRLTVNVSQSYLVLYLTDTLVFEKEAIAYFPLIVLVSGVLASFFMKFLNRKIGSKLTYIVGCILAVGACCWFFFLSRDSHSSVYPATILMGAGSSVMLVTSLAMTADLIGSHKSSGAFVYAAMSFTDKLSSGIVIAVIQALKPESSSNVYCPPCAVFTKYVQAVVPGASAILALLCVALFFPTDFILRKKACYTDAVTQTEQDDKDGPSQPFSDVVINDDATVLQECDDDEPVARHSVHDLDDSLKRLSWHSAMTSYVAWRLASPQLPSPVAERRCCTPQGDPV